MADIFPPKFPFAPISTIFGLQGKQGMPSWMAMTKNNFEWPFSKWLTFSRQFLHLLRFQWFLVYMGNRVCWVLWQWQKYFWRDHFQNGRHFPGIYYIHPDLNDFWFIWELLSWMAMLITCACEWGLNRWAIQALVSLLFTRYHSLNCFNLDWLRISFHNLTCTCS